jgi:hypothetical protein
MAQANAWYQDPATVFPVSVQRWQEFAQTYTWTNQFGNQVHLSAKEWFVKSNIWKAISGGTVVANPPRSPSLEWFPSITIYWDTAGIYCECYPPPTNELFLYIRKAGPVSYTRNFCPNNIAFAGLLTAGTGSPVLLVPAIDIDADPHNWFFIIRVIDDWGKSSNKIYFKVYTEGAAPTAVFAPNEDTFLDKNSPNTNRSTSVRDRIQFNFGVFTSRSLISLDLSALTYTYVDKSYFYFFCDTGLSAIGNNTYHQDLSAYVDAEVTWNDESTGVPWGTPGGTAGTDYATIPFTNFSNDQSVSGFYRIEITNQMNAWLSGVTPTRFWGIGSLEGQDFYHASIDWATPSQRPFILNVPNVAV